MNNGKRYKNIKNPTVVYGATSSSGSSQQSYKKVSLANVEMVKYALNLCCLRIQLRLHIATGLRQNMAQLVFPTFFLRLLNCLRL
jgi:hypothetical protein